MKETERREMTILFADVAGSVKLHTTLGDIEAHRRIVDTLRRMALRVESCQGRVVETIGDEIMCSFNAADNALEAACDIQDSLKDGPDSALFARIGMHSGLTGEENGQPFGDTINIAARVVALAKAGQVMLTDDVWQRLSEPNRARTRFFSSVHLKGKREPYTIYQAQWNTQDGTVILPVGTAPVSACPTPPGHIQLRHQSTETNLTEGTELLLGRGTQCDLQIPAEGASRIHATLKCQAGKLVLTDRSTNGTFVRTLADNNTENGAELFFHHSEWITSGSGMISLGAPVANGGDNLLYFECR